MEKIEEKTLDDKAADFIGGYTTRNDEVIRFFKQEIELAESDHDEMLLTDLLTKLHQPSDRVLVPLDNINNLIDQLIASEEGFKEIGKEELNDYAIERYKQLLEMLDKFYGDEK